MKYTINNNKYKLRALLSEISLNDAIAISKLGLTDEMLLNIQSGSDPLTEDARVYSIKVLSILSDTPIDILDKLPIIELEVLLDAVIYFIEMLYYLNFDRFEPLPLTKMKFKGTTYHLPPSLKVNDKDIPCYKESCKIYTEASNIVDIFSKMKSEGIHVLKYLCALYWKEDIEEGYNEEQINKRAEKFGELPMDIVFSTFFFIYSYILHYTISSLNYLSLRKRMLIKVQKIYYMTLGYIMWLKLKLQALFKK